MAGDTVAGGEEEMRYEQSFLDAVDRCLCRLAALGIACSSLSLRSMVRSLVRWLLGIRHVFLDEFVYSLVATLRKSIMDSVSVVVASASALNKLQAGTSDWSDWFHKRLRGLLLMDEFPALNMEQVTACMFGFDVTRRAFTCCFSKML